MTREEAIEVYNGLINEKIKAAFEFFAPELRESKEEKIRQFLIERMNSLYGADSVTPEGIAVNDIVSYLEKQKETVSTENQAVKVGDDETEAQKAYREGKIAGRQEVIDHPDYYQLIKPEEQDSEEVFNKIDNSFRKGREVGFREGVESVKPAEWSEEDETRLTNIINMLGEYLVHNYSKDDIEDDIDKSITWLKSLRPSWKPSKEHIDAIETAINELQSTRPYRSEIIYLKSILEHIKNL